MRRNLIQDADVFVKIGINHLKKGRSAEAAEAFIEAQRIEPFDIENLLHIGTVYLAINDPMTALEYFVQGQEKARSDFRPWFYVGKALIECSKGDSPREDDLKGALMYLRVAKRLKKNDKGNILSLIAECHDLLGKHKTAEEIRKQIFRPTRTKRPA